MLLVWEQTVYLLFWMSDSHPATLREISESAKCLNRRWWSDNLWFWSISSADIYCIRLTHSFGPSLPLKRHLALVLILILISHLSGCPFICHVFVSRSHVCKISLEMRTFLWHADQKNFVTKTTWCWMKLVRPPLTSFWYGWYCLLKKRETCSPSQETLVWQCW